jgi:mannose-6-phosphate isomerase-like protein (cupin superfamily)
MAGYTAKQISEMETGFSGGFVKVRAELGVTSFGVQVIRLPPDFPDYPEHDHSEDGQEEVYLALEGSGSIDIEGERVELSKDTFVRIAPGTKRKVPPGPDGLTMLVIGGRPGEKYEIAEMTELTGAAS